MSSPLAYRFDDDEIAFSGKWAKELARGKKGLLGGHEGPVEVGG